MLATWFVVLVFHVLLWTSRLSEACQPMPIPNTIGGGRTVVCQDEWHRISCDRPERIFVLSAVYGRGDNLSCGGGPDLICKSDVTSKVEQLDGRYSAVVRASNALMGADPCPDGVRNVLVVHWDCFSSNDS